MMRRSSFKAKALSCLLAIAIAIPSGALAYASDLSASSIDSSTTQNSQADNLKGEAAQNTNTNDATTIGGNSAPSSLTENQTVNENQSNSPTSGEAAKDPSSDVEVKEYIPSVSYSAHVQNIGWQTAVSDGKEAGTTGNGQRVEALKVYLSKGTMAAFPDSHISYSTHIQDQGWQETPSLDGAVSGTEGKGLRVEALRISLTGSLADKYDVWYRVHAQDYGWMGWTKNGLSAGSEGYSKRIEAVEIILLANGSNPPGSTDNSFVHKHAYGEWTVLTAPTCTEDGTNIRTCTNEGCTSFETQVVPKLGHDGPWTIIDEPTQTEEGLMSRICTREGCGEQEERTIDPIALSYSAHVQNVGWQTAVSENKVAGTEGQALRVEALKITLPASVLEAYPDSHIAYQTHVQNVGWQNAVSDGSTAGTEGASQRVEAIRVSLTGELADKYDVWYQVHVENQGWMGWTKDGLSAGTEGLEARLEAVKIQLLPKGSNPPGSTDNSFIHKHTYGEWYTTIAPKCELSGEEERICSDECCQATETRSVEKLGHEGPWAIIDEPTQTEKGLMSRKCTREGCGVTELKAIDPVELSYSAHVQDVGWQASVHDGELAGTTGRGLRVEAFKVSLPETIYQAYPDSHVTYSAHIQNIGWQKDPSADGAVAGTEGQALRVEAIKINLDGELAEQYDVWYHVHVSYIGWLDWASNGEPAGTEEYALPIEAFEVMLLPKGSEAPGSTLIPFISPTTTTVAYSAYSNSYQWQEPVKNGATAGTTGLGLPMEAFEAAVIPEEYGSIQYRMHVANIGWQDYVDAGEVAGTTDTGNQAEAISIRLTGKLADYYDVYYRAHVANYGWLGWASNGANAGTQSMRCGMQAVQVVLVAKGAAPPGSTAGAFIRPLSYGELLSSVDWASGTWGLAGINTDYNFSSGAGQWLQAELNSLRSSGYDVSFVMIDLTTGRGACSGADGVYYSASTIKGPYVAAINKYSSPAGWEQTMLETINVSSNYGYALLRQNFGGDIFAWYMDYAGIGGHFDPYVNYTYFTPKDLAKMWIANYQYFYNDMNGNSAWCRSLYTSSLNSVIYYGLGGNYLIHSKPGWIGEARATVQNDGGIVMAGDHPYVIALMTSAYGQYDRLCNLVRAIDAVHSEIL